MEKAVLIVNPTGQLSACPTKEQFERDQFITDNMLVFDVEASMPVLLMLKLAAKTAWFVGEGLPKPDPQPGRVYLAIVKGKLYPTN